MRKVVGICLVMMCLLAGCRQGEMPMQEVTGVGSTLEVEISEKENTATEVANSESEEAQHTTDNNVSEQEAYILTFEATNLEGETVTDACFSDSKLTMINVWATYCNPCLMEMPDLGAIAASYDVSEFQMIGIVSDVADASSEEHIAYARELVEQTGADYPHLLLSDSLFQNLVGAVEAVPTTFFVNEKGEVLGYAVGANSKEGWEEIIREVLAEME